MSSPSPFGQNEWLVEEMYRKFREDPSSVDPSWHEFLVDYSPEPTTEAQSTAGNGQPAQAATPAAAPERAPAPAPKAEVAAPVKAPEPEKAAATPKTAFSGTETANEFELSSIVQPTRLTDEVPKFVSSNQSEASGLLPLDHGAASVTASVIEPLEAALIARL